MHDGRTSWRHQPAALDADLRAAARRVHGGPLPVAKETVEGVLRKPRAAGAGGAVDDRTVGLVVGRQHDGGIGRSQQPAGSELTTRRHPWVEQHAVAVGLQTDHTGRPDDGADHRLLLRLRPPRPGVAEPERRQHVQRGRVGAAVHGRDPDGDLLGRCLGVFNEDVEPAVVGKDSCVEEFVLWPLSLPTLVFGHQLFVGKRPLWVAVSQAHERVRGSVVDVEVILLHVLAVVPLEWADAKKPFLEVRVRFVPEGRRKAEQLKTVADAGDAILAPAVGLGPRQPIGEMSPGIAIGRIVLPNRTPRTV